MMTSSWLLPVDKTKLLLLLPWVLKPKRVRVMIFAGRSKEGGMKIFAA
jgi:hypothetical protein